MSLLTGQMVRLSADHILFVGSPKLTLLNEMRDKDIYIKDFPIYDMTREFVLLNQLRNTEIDITSAQYFVL